MSAITQESGGDIRLRFDNHRGDFRIENNIVDRDEGLETGTVISLFTDARLPSGYDLPRSGDRRGWWGTGFVSDTKPWGSLLWTLEGYKMTTETLNRAKQYSVDSLLWMVDDGIVDRSDVTTERLGTYHMGIYVIHYRPDSVPVRYAFNWDAQARRAA